MPTGAYPQCRRATSLLVLCVFGFVIACRIGTTLGAQHCLQCLGNRELVEFCNTTSSLQQCGDNTESCYMAIVNRGGRLFATKGCILSNLCQVRADVNDALCDRGVALATCVYCCGGDSCNFDWFKYSATLEPTTPEPEVSTEPEVTTELVVSTSMPLLSTVAPLNCESDNLTRCVRDYEEAIFFAMRDPRKNFPYFCRQVPLMFQCIAQALTSCCPDNRLAVHDQLTSVSNVMWAQCPRECDVTEGQLCTSVIVTCIIRDIIWGNATCETMRTTVLGYQKCLVIHTGTCGTIERVTFELKAKIINSAIEMTCTESEPEVTMAPSMTSPATDVTTAAGVQTTTYGSGCEPDIVEECLIQLAIALTQPQDPDHEHICNTLIPDAAACLANHSRACAPEVQMRLRHAYNFTLALHTEDCVVTTATPLVCNTSAARACALDIWNVIDELGDYGLACKMVEETTECMRSNVTGCTDREKLSLNRTLDIVLKTLEGHCDQVVVTEGDCANLTLEEGGEEVVLRFHGNQNPEDLCEGALDCEVYVEAVIENQGSPRCQDGTSIPQIVCRPETPPTSGPACAVRLTSDNWRETHSIHLAATLDNKVDGDQKRQVALIYKKVIGGILAEVMTLETCQVTIIDHDTTGQCSSLNDPHINTFDGVQYDNFFEGNFVLYRHTTLPYEVQVLYQRCGSRVTCNCGVAIKSGDYVFFVEMCRRRRVSPRCRRHRHHCKDLMRARSFVWDGVTPGTRVFKRPTGFDVILPHGTRVRIQKVDGLVNVWVMPSAADYRHTTGLCGMYDGLKEKDLVLPDGEVWTGVMTAMKSFCRAWRITNRGEQLHRGAPYAPFHPPTYCACPDKDCKETPTCLPRHLVSTCDIDTDGEITFDDLPEVKTDDEQTRKKRDVTAAEDFDFDIEFDPEEISPGTRTWTEAEAQEHCAAYLGGSQLVQVCRFQAMVEMEYYINICVQDILLTDDTKWELSALEGAKTDCVHTVQAEPKFADTDTNRHIVTKINNANCPLECSGNGICDEGSCICGGQYVGASCSVKKDAVPKFLDTDDDGLCDVRKTNCAKIVVYADDIINSPKLSCHLTMVKITEKGIINMAGGKEDVLKAEYLSSNQVTCSVPRAVSKASTWLGHGYLVDLSNDMLAVSGGPVLHVIQDPRCHSCTITDLIAGTTCVRKPESCIVEGRCYQAGEMSPHDACRVCDPAHSASSFRHKKSFACLGLLGILIVAAVVILVVIVTALVVMCCCCRNQKSGLSMTQSWRKRMEEGIAHELLHK